LATANDVDELQFQKAFNRHPNSPPHPRLRLLLPRWVSNVSLAFERLESALLRNPDLYQLINENCPDAIKTGEIKNQFGRKVAIVRYAIQFL
jgi:hypothetical protein